MKSEKKGLWLLLAIVAFVAIGIVIYMVFFNTPRLQAKNYSELQQYIRNGEVTEIDIENDKATFKLKSGTSYYSYVPE